jgi:hypothetical protein
MIRIVILIFPLLARVYFNLILMLMFHHCYVSSTSYFRPVSRNLRKVVNLLLMEGTLDQAEVYPHYNGKCIHSCLLHGFQWKINIQDNTVVFLFSTNATRVYLHSAYMRRNGLKSARGVRE